ncbi:hypothetical protein [Protofrankia coriariae]|uniref:Uncharacterized protein n=1 Tax=Protofrankia coriariae TaxID=1562887 RepID=A0ABR5F2Z4_9ACTN|nr:hypothetical protein [Protofrankia coriariae]KLL11030.1 hypothetical protein FrCorBMG51_14075 [Protofrankia coriariae]
MTVTAPAPEDVGHRTTEIIRQIRNYPEFLRLKEAALLYPECWATFTGYPIITEWDLTLDGPPLFDEAIRTLALKTTVFTLTGGNEAAAELAVAAPVDEMVHAVLAQHTLISRMQRSLALDLVHMTDQEQFDYEPGCYTDACYQAAGWGEPNRRYWIGAQETARRHTILNGLYASVGINPGGRAHRITFDVPEPALPG